MNTDIRTAEEDLAFLRSVVERGEGTTGAWGESYFAAGLIYGAQMLLHAQDRPEVIKMFQNRLIKMTTGLPKLEA